MYIGSWRSQDNCSWIRATMRAVIRVMAASWAGVGWGGLAPQALLRQALHHVLGLLLHLLQQGAGLGHLQQAPDRGFAGRLGQGCRTPEQKDKEQQVAD